MSAPNIDTIVSLSKRRGFVFPASDIYGGLGAAAAFCVYQAYLLKDRDAVMSFRAFLNNAWLGGAVFAGIVLDYTFRG